MHAVWYIIKGLASSDFRSFFSKEAFVIIGGCLPAPVVARRLILQRYICFGGCAAKMGKWRRSPLFLLTVLLTQIGKSSKVNIIIAKPR